MLADELDGIRPAILTAMESQLGASANQDLLRYTKERLPAIIAELVAVLRADRLDSKPPAVPIGRDTSLVAAALRVVESAVHNAIDQRQLQVSARQMRLIGGYFSAAIEAALQARIHLFGVMFDAIPDALLLTNADPAPCYLYLNRAAGILVEGMTGLKRDALLGRGIFELPFPESFVHQVTDAWTRARRGEAVTSELLVPTPHGERWYERHANPLFDSEGRVEAIVLASRDIDARKRAEENLAHELAFRERMVGILGHDLRNPVSAVLGIAGLAQLQDGVSDKLREQLELIVQAARRMNEMITTLLDFTQLRFRGDLHLTPAPMDLADAARVVVDELRAAHPKRQIVLSSRGDVRGDWDAARLAQLISNLVANALTYGFPEAAVQVDLRVEDAVVALSVSNHGLAIPATAIPHLFEPFYQARQEGRSRSRGLGLGLHIVRAIADAHGGVVDVSSDATLTTFTVRLPRRDDGRS
jgi:PAS domain S-box-containing protein